MADGVVFLWTSHRCAGTAFERSIRELESVKVLHEPNCLAFFCEDGNLRDDPDSVYEAKMKYILSEMQQCASGGYKYLFIKELAYHLGGRYNNYIQGESANFKHTFLIRDPVAVAHSMQGLAVQNGITPYFTDTLGFQELCNMYEIVKDVNSTRPVVVSAEDVVNNPRDMMEVYCKSVGLPFSDKMVEWEPKKVFHDWKQYPMYEVWHKKVMDSTGFVKHTEKQMKSSADLLPEYRDAVKNALPYYEKLNSLRIIPVLQARP